MKKATKRNWPRYNQKLKRQARLELYVSSEIFAPYDGKRRPGGVVLYQDNLIEACLLVREYFSLALRQTQGFMESLAITIGENLAVPDYTTLSRRSRTCKVSLSSNITQLRQGCIIAVDSTGLSLMTSDSWNRYKHRKNKGNYAWHKLHIAMDTQSGDILACEDTPATINDCQVLPSLIKTVPHDNIGSVCADMAYDTVDCRKAIAAKKARQLIPPKSTAIPTAERKNPYPPTTAHLLKERDEAINYIRANTQNGDDSLARKRWKELVGYHKRSLAESTMSRIKAHAGSVLKSKRDDTKSTECRIKCKLMNLLNHA